MCVIYSVPDDPFASLANGYLGKNHQNLINFPFYIETIYIKMVLRPQGEFPTSERSLS